MVTYLVLNIAVLLAIAIIIGKPTHKPSKAWYFTLVVLLILTAIFDNVIVGLDIVDYNPDKILGVFIAVAPIEDFMYAVLAAVIIPTIWNRVGAKNAH